MQKTLRIIHGIEDFILIALLLVTVLLAGVDILARLVFDSGVIWIPPTLRVLVLWLGLLGALLATRTREHIAIDVVGRLAPVRARHLINAITSLFASGVSLLIAWHGQRFIQMAMEFGDIAFAKVPAWPLQLIIPISFLLMGMRFFVQSLQSSAHFIKGEAAQ